MRARASATVIILALLLYGPAGCGGPNATQQRITLATAAITAAHDGFVVWNLEHQKELIDRAVAEGKTPAEAKEILSAFRDRRAEVVMAFMDAFQAAAEALRDPNPATLATLVQKSLKLQDTLKQLR